VEYSHPAWLRFWVSAASHRGGTGAEDAVLGHVHSSLGPGDLALEEPRGMGETGALLSRRAPVILTFQSLEFSVACAIGCRLHLRCVSRKRRFHQVWLLRESMSLPGPHAPFQLALWSFPIQGRCYRDNCGRASNPASCVPNRPSASAKPSTARRPL
jgi:hypothetical protein